MTTEEKDLLRKDLCARFPYGVIVSVTDGTIKYEAYIESVSYQNIQVSPVSDSVFTPYTFYKISEIKPYLRPMESMTEEEKEEYEKLCILIPTQFDSDLQKYDYYTTDSMESFDWLLKNHFDVRDLIEKGLAIAVTEDNNPYK